MREQIPRRQGGRRHGVLEGKIGQVGAYGSVERDPSLVREQRDRRCRESLRAGADREERVGRDRQTSVDIAVTEAASEDEAPPLDDSHGHARDLVTRHETADQRSEVVREVVREPRGASGPEPERQQAEGHEERRLEPMSRPHATAGSGTLWTSWTSSWTFSGIRKREQVRRIITLEKKTSPMNRPTPRCNPIAAMAHALRVRR